MIIQRRIGFERHVGKDFAEKKPGSVVPVQQVAVLALPAQSGPGGERFFEYRRAVGENPVAHGTADLDDTIGVTLQTLAHELVVIAPQRVAGYVGAIGMIQQLEHVLLRLDQVIDLAVKIGLDPLPVSGMLRIEIGIGDADLLKSQLETDAFDGIGYRQGFEPDGMSAKGPRIRVHLSGRLVQYRIFRQI